jgi:hypothetical protein
VPRLLVVLATLISAYTVYALVLVERNFRNGSTGALGLAWGIAVAALMFALAGLMVVTARRRSRRRNGHGSSDAVNLPMESRPRRLSWILVGWIPIAMFLIGLGVNGLDVGIIFAFAGLLLAPVVIPTLSRDGLWSSVTVQGVQVSLAVALFFWPPYVTAAFFAFDTHHRIVAAGLFAIGAPLFRLLDVLVRRCAPKLTHRQPALEPH